MLKINGDTIFTAQRPNIWSFFIESKCSETSFVLLSCRHQRIIIQQFSTRWPERASAQWSIELFHRSVAESQCGDPYFILITKGPFVAQKSPCFVSKLLSGEWVYRLVSIKEWWYFELDFKKIQSVARRGNSLASSCYVAGFQRKYVVGLWFTRKERKCCSRGCLGHLASLIFLG